MSQPRTFIITPFGKKKNQQGNEIDFNRTLNDLIMPALKACGILGGTAGEIVKAGNIREDMFKELVNADIVLCDITIHNANVFYELGVRHSLRKRNTVLLKGNPEGDQTPFDVSTDRYMAYPIANPSEVVDQLVTVIKRTLASDNETDSPVFRYLNDLPEAPFLYQVPKAFREDLRLAFSSNHKGLMRTLAYDVIKTRFSIEGLHIIAKQQKEMGDHEEAIKNWESIRRYQPNHLGANEGLANLYEREFSKSGDKSSFDKSEIAIQRIFDNPNATLDQKAEAQTLKGRNRKSLWRFAFKDYQTIEERKQKAINRYLFPAFQEYEKAYRMDLNRLYSGLVALQMGTILLNLNKEKPGEVANLLPSDKLSESLAEIKRTVNFLKIVVGELINEDINNPEIFYIENQQPDVWLQISQADYQFLTSEDHKDESIIQRYIHVIPPSGKWYWNSARRQLELFASLGIKADLANKIIHRVEAGLIPDKVKKPTQVILFTGHMIDDKHRPSPRFSLENVAHIQKAIKENISNIADHDGHEVIGYASCSPGSDILFHEECHAMGIPTVILLPCSWQEYNKKFFKDFSDWRNRYLAFHEKCEKQILTSKPELPKWLVPTDTNFWERGNRWALETAKADGDRVDFLSVWDEKPGEIPGGTAHMHELVSNEGTIHMENIPL